MKTKEELLNALDFISEYATYMLASGVHTSRTLRCTQRIGVSQDIEVHFSTFQKSTIISVRDVDSSEVITRVVPIPSLPINFQRNADLGTLSWTAMDEGLSLETIREKFNELTAKALTPPLFVLLAVGVANASFCKLFGGDWISMLIVFISTLIAFALKQQLQSKELNHFLVFIITAFAASLLASVSLFFKCSSEVAIATSVLFLVPGVPLINGVIDIVEGYILIGYSRLINAALLIFCIGIGLSATLMIVKNGLLQ